MLLFFLIRRLVLYGYDVKVNRSIYVLHDKGQAASDISNTPSVNCVRHLGKCELIIMRLWICQNPSPTAAFLKPEEKSSVF